MATKEIVELEAYELKGVFHPAIPVTHIEWDSVLEYAEACAKALANKEGRVYIERRTRHDLVQCDQIHIRKGSFIARPLLFADSLADINMETVRDHFFYTLGKLEANK